MMRRCAWIVALFTLVPAGLGAQSAAGGTPARDPAADSAGIRGAALDYIEGWYEGDAERMERALHPDLAKRILMRDPATGDERLDDMSAARLVEGTRRGGGKKTPAERRLKDVTILDVYGNAASAKVVASDWVDYLHLVRTRDRWVIVNVLWELKPRP